ncbi:MAG: hypothetical protein JSW01_02590, partial [Candidatus Bathyarchaeota archaeon]
DTPKLVRDAQLEMINVLAKAETREDVPSLLPEAIRVLRQYVDRLKTRRVDMEELVITTRLSKDPEEYDRSLLQGIAARQLVREGMRIHAGESVQYLIRDAYNSNPNLRVIPFLLLNSRMCYDLQKYLEMLINAAATVLDPFGLTEEEIQYAVKGQRQMLLSE